MTTMGYPRVHRNILMLKVWNELVEVDLGLIPMQPVHSALGFDRPPKDWVPSRAAYLAQVLNVYTGRDASPGEVVGPGARALGLFSLLHLAAQEDMLGIARLLLDWGADPSDCNELGRTPLHEAAARGQGRVGPLLLRCGADPKARHASGKTALHFAAQSQGAEDEELVGALLDLGLSASDTETLTLNTPLHLAAQAGKAKVARLLLERGADPRARNREGRTPLHLAANSGEVLKLLLERGADLKAVDATGCTPLQLLGLRKIEEARIVIRRLVRDEVISGIAIDDKNDRAIKSVHMWGLIRRSCKAEIDTMKNAICYRANRYVTAFDLLSMSLPELAVRMQNRSLSFMLGKLHLKDYFSMYGEELDNKIKRAHEAKAHRHRVEHFLFRSLGNSLPLAVVSKIGEYLTPRDIRFR